jgi:hypothetical protein
VLRCLLGLAEAAGTSSGGHLLAQFYPQNRYGPSKQQTQSWCRLAPAMASGPYGASQGVSGHLLWEGISRLGLLVEWVHQEELCVAVAQRCSSPPTPMMSTAQLYVPEPAQLSIFGNVPVSLPTTIVLPLTAAILMLHACPGRLLAPDKHSMPNHTSSLPARFRTL